MHMRSGLPAAKHLPSANSRFPLGDYAARLSVHSKGLHNTHAHAHAEVERFPDSTVHSRKLPFRFQGPQFAPRTKDQGPPSAFAASGKDHQAPSPSLPPNLLRALGPSPAAQTKICIPALGAVRTLRNGLWPVSSGGWTGLCIRYHYCNVVGPGICILHSDRHQYGNNRTTTPRRHIPTQHRNSVNDLNTRHTVHRAQPPV